MNSSQAVHRGRGHSLGGQLLANLRATPLHAEAANTETTRDNRGGHSSLSEKLSGLGRDDISDGQATETSPASAAAFQPQHQLDHPIDPSTSSLGVGILEPLVDGSASSAATPVTGGFSGMEHLLFGLEQHEDERQGLCLTAHHATLRVKESHSALKLSLEPLTFAYGEDDGREYFEKILNSPEAYVSYIS